MIVSSGTTVTSAPCPSSLRFSPCCRRKCTAARFVSEPIGGPRSSRTWRITPALWSLCWSDMFLLLLFGRLVLSPSGVPLFPAPVVSLDNQIQMSWIVALILPVCLCVVCRRRVWRRRGTTRRCSLRCFGVWAAGSTSESSTATSWPVTSCSWSFSKSW